MRKSSKAFLNFIHVTPSRANMLFSILF